MKDKTKIRFFCEPAQSKCTWILHRSLCGKTMPHVLCQPAPSKCTWTCHKSHLIRQFTGKNARAQNCGANFVRACAVEMHLDNSQDRAPVSSFFWHFLFCDLSSSLLFSDSSHLCFSSVHIVGSLTSKLPSIVYIYIYNVYIYIYILKLWYCLYFRMDIYIYMCMKPPASQKIVYD